MPTVHDWVYKDPRWAPARARCLNDARGLCQICYPGICKVRANVADHIKPLSAGGARFAQSNLQAACVPCNTAKGQRARRTVGPSRDWRTV